MGLGPLAATVPCCRRTQVSREALKSNQPFPGDIRTAIVEGNRQRFSKMHFDSTRKVPGGTCPAGGTIKSGCGRMAGLAGGASPAGIGVKAETLPFAALAMSCDRAASGACAYAGPSGLRGKALP